MSLVVSLIARTAAFTKGMRGGGKSVNRFSNSVHASSRRVAGFAKGLVALAVTGGLAMMIKRTMDSIDATAKFSRTIGIATEQLIGLRHAASIMGADAATLDKSLETLTRRIGETNLGVGQAAYALDQLGLSAKELEKQSPDENFKQIAESIKGLDTAAQQASAAYYLFGRQGMKLLETLKLGRSGIEELQAEIKKLGAGFTDLDAQKVENANDSFGRMRLMLTGATQVLAIELAPYLESSTNQLIEMGTAGEGMGRKVVNSFAWILRAIGYVADAFVYIKMTFQALIASALMLIGQLTEKFGFLSKTAQAYGDSMIAEADRLYAANDKAFENMPSKRIQTFIDGVNKGMEAVKAKTKDAGGSFTESFKKMADGLDKANEKLKEQIDTWGLTKREADLFNLEKLGEGLTGAELDVFNTKLAETKRLMDDLTKKESIEEAAEASEKAAEKAADEAQARIDKIESFADGVKESLKGPIDKLKDFREKLKEAVAAGFLTEDQSAAALRKMAEGLLSGVEGAKSTVGRGEAQEIRTAYVDVAGLSMGADPMIQKMEEQNQKTDKTNSLLSQVVTAVAD